MTHLINYASSSFVVHMSCIIGTVLPPFVRVREGEVIKYSVIEGEGEWRGKEHSL